MFATDVIKLNYIIGSIKANTAMKDTKNNAKATSKHWLFSHLTIFQVFCVFEARWSI